MIKTFLIFLLFASSAYAKDYFFTPSRVIDGDTIEIKERIFGLKLFIRVDGIDTPEKGAKARCGFENDLALKASAFTTDFVANQTLKVSGLKWDKYGGRMLGGVKVGKRDLAQELIGKGLAREYHGEKKEGWCN